MASLAAAIDQYLNSIPDGAWLVWVLGGHDKPRIASKIGIEQVRVGAMSLFTLPGTPIFHAGDEIGMPNGKIAPEQVRDPFGRLGPEYGLNRDSSRTPMLWDASAKAGFTTGDPWLPIDDQIEDRNVATQRDDCSSMLWLYRRLIALRRTEPASLSGYFQPRRSQGNTLLFARRLDCQSLLVALNIGHCEQIIQISGRWRVRLSTPLDRSEEETGETLVLRGAEGVILRAL